MQDASSSLEPTNCALLVGLTYFCSALLGLVLLLLLLLLLTTTINTIIMFTIFIPITTLVALGSEEPCRPPPLNPGLPAGDGCLPPWPRALLPLGQLHLNHKRPDRGGHKSNSLRKWGSRCSPGPNKLPDLLAPPASHHGLHDLVQPRFGQSHLGCRHRGAPGSISRLDSHPGQPDLQPLLVCRHQDVQRSAGLARPRCPLFPLWWSLSLWPRLHLYLPSRDSRQDSGGNGSKLSKTQSSPDSGTLRCLQVCKQDNSKPYKLASKGQLQFVQKLCIYFYIPVLHALYCDKNQIYCLDSRHQLIQSQNKLK